MGLITRSKLGTMGTRFYLARVAVNMAELAKSLLRTLAYHYLWQLILIKCLGEAGRYICITQGTFHPQ